MTRKTSALPTGTRIYGAHSGGSVLAHESQQLECAPQQAFPPTGATQWTQSDLIEHLIVPLAFTLQQVWKPGLPQVDLA